MITLSATVVMITHHQGRLNTYHYSINYFLIITIEGNIQEETTTLHGVMIGVTITHLATGVTTILLPVETTILLPVETTIHMTAVMTFLGIVTSHAVMTIIYTPPATPGVTPLLNMSPKKTPNHLKKITNPHHPKKMHNQLLLNHNLYPKKKYNHELTWTRPTTLNWGLANSQQRKRTKHQQLLLLPPHPHPHPRKKCSLAPLLQRKKKYSLGPLLQQTKKPHLKKRSILAPNLLNLQHQHNSAEREARCQPLKIDLGSLYPNSTAWIFYLIYLTTLINPIMGIASTFSSAAWKEVLPCVSVKT